MKITLAIALCFAVLPTTQAMAATSSQARDVVFALGSGGLKGKKLKKAIEAAGSFPLGSRQNPVRENMPAGEIAYLSRLRCPDGNSATFSRTGSTGIGPYGFILDLYKVACAGADPVDVYIDMYHDGGELRPIPGFSIVAP